MAASLSTVVLILSSIAGMGVAVRDTNIVTIDADTKLTQKALALLKRYTNATVTADKVNDMLSNDLALRGEVSRFPEHHLTAPQRKKYTAALLERARGVAGVDAAALDKTVRAKETPCHCVIEKVTEVNMDRDLKIDVAGTYLSLDFDDFPVSPERATADIELVDIDKEKNYGKKSRDSGFASFFYDSESECHEGCFEHCKADDKYHMDPEELHMLGVERDMPTMVAAQCDEAKCLCLDMDTTKKHLKALKPVSDKKLDVCSDELEMFEDEATCLSECKPVCERLERAVDSWDGSRHEIDWEGVCFDEFHSD